jgi:hypothetical protein
MNIGEDKSVEKGWRGRFQGFKVSRFQGFKVSRFQGFKVSVSWRRQPRYPPFATNAKDVARRSC